MGAWVLALSLWGEPLPNTCPPSPNLPRTSQEPGHCFSSSFTHPGLGWFYQLYLPSCPSTLVLSPRDSGRRSKRHSPDWEATGAEL